jgi:hypothetical protein
MKLNFLGQFSKNNQSSHFMKIRPVGAELLQAEGRTDGQKDMKKLTVDFSKFFESA